MIDPDFNENGFLSPKLNTWTKFQKFDENECYNLCIKINKFAETTLYNLIIHNKDLQELLLSTLFLRSLSIYQSVILLIEKGMNNEVKI